MNDPTRRESLVFGLLLLLAVAGRWAEPTWNFTPLAAVTAFGGYYFRNWWPAVLLPVTTLAISDLLLPAHDNVPVMIAVHLMMVVPLLLGRAANAGSTRRRLVCWGMCGFVPATAFFLVTNFAVWAFQGSGPVTYPMSWAGLMTCYGRGLPFYRTMLAGDLFYFTALAGSLVLAHWLSAQGAQRQVAKASSAA
jgi:hypothetical protein